MLYYEGTEGVGRHLDPIAKMQAAIVALRDQFGGMQTDIREVKSTMERLDVTVTGAVTSLSTMEEAVTELGTSLSSIARKQDEQARQQDEQAQILQAHEDAINELKKQTGGSP